MGDRIFAAGPITREPAGWMRPDREASELQPEEERAVISGALRHFLPVHSSPGVCLHFADAETEV